MLDQPQNIFSAYPTVTFLSVMIVFGWLGYLIVTRYLMQKQIRNFLPKSIFMVTFTCSLSLLTMYLYSISQINVNMGLWDMMLSLLVIMCTIIIPICLLCLPLMNYKFKICLQIKLPFLAIIVIIIYLKVLMSWSYEIAEKKQLKSQIISKIHINTLVQILVNYGVYIMAMMSAYGSIWCPYVYFNHIETQRSNLIKAKAKVREEMKFIIEQIRKNKLQILNLSQRQKYLENVIQQSRLKKSNQSFLMRSIKALSSFSKNKTEQELSSVKQKLQFHRKQLQTVEKVHSQSFSVYREIVDQEKKHDISETWTGKLFYVFSFFLVVYSISRIILTAWNMFNGRKLSTDPITRLINLINWIQGQDINGSLRLYSQYISFAFMGYLMISSVRSFSINIKNLFDFILRRRKLNMLSTDTLVLLLSQIYGIYFLSAVILLQSSLPHKYVTNFENITGQVSLLEHFTLFDKLFFWSCMLSIIIILICEYHRKQKMKYIQERNLITIE